MKNRRPQYVAVALGWAYNGLLLGLTMAAVFSPGHRLLLDFNQYGELWADGYYASTSGNGLSPQVIAEYAQYQPYQRLLEPLVQRG